MTTSDEEKEEDPQKTDKTDNKQTPVVEDSAESSTEEVLSDTETIDVSINDVLDANSVRAESKAEKITG